MPQRGVNDRLADSDEKTVREQTKSGKLEWANPTYRAIGDQDTFGARETVRYATPKPLRAIPLTPNP
jgi:hypothetical protein